LGKASADLSDFSDLDSLVVSEAVSVSKKLWMNHFTRLIKKKALSMPRKRRLLCVTFFNATINLTHKFDHSKLQSTLQAIEETGIFGVAQFQFAFVSPDDMKPQTVKCTNDTHTFDWHLSLVLGAQCQFLGVKQCYSSNDVTENYRYAFSAN
jgi:hypothetical protein